MMEELVMPAGDGPPEDVRLGLHLCGARWDTPFGRGSLYLSRGDAFRPLAPFALIVSFAVLSARSP